MRLLLLLRKQKRRVVDSIDAALSSFPPAHLDLVLIMIPYICQNIGKSMSITMAMILNLSFVLMEYVIVAQKLVVWTVYVPAMLGIKRLQNNNSLGSFIDAEIIPIY